MRPLHLWMLNHYAQSPRLPGGTRHFELAARLGAMGFDITLIGSGFHHVTRSAEPTVTELAADSDFRMVSIPGRIRYQRNGLARMLGMAEFAVRVLRWGRKREHRTDASPDLVFASSPHLLAAWAGMRLARRYRVPFVFEVRDLWPDSLVALGALSERHPLVWMLRRLERQLIRRADLIVSLLPDAHLHMRQVCPRVGDILWLPNGANVAPDDSVAMDHVEHDEMTVMYVGAMGRANVLCDLLDAAETVGRESVDRIRFVLVGEGPEKAALQQRAVDRGLCNVAFRAAVPKTEVPSLLARADICIALLEDTPLYRFGISLNKLFDYMAAGRPIVFAGNVAHNYVQLAQCGITVPPRNAQAIAEAIETFHGMTAADRLAMGERGRQYVKVHHSWDGLAAILADALDTVAARSLVQWGES